MAEFIPAILVNSKAATDAALRELAPYIRRVHFDFADNTLVPNQTVLPDQLTETPVSIQVDAHLMVSEPWQYFADLYRLGFERAVIHHECQQPNKALSEARDYSLATALAVNPETDLSEIAPLVEAIDFLQIMSIHPGFTNQPFLVETYERIRRSKQLYPTLRVAVDGGVRFHNAIKLIDAGADILIASQSGYQIEGNVEKGLTKWQQLLKMNKRP